MGVTEDRNPPAGMVKRKVLAALRGIQCDLERDPKALEDIGICVLMERRLGRSDWWFGAHVRPILTGLFARWPEFSGDLVYPVPARRARLNIAYHRFDKWTDRTAYGRARRSLLAFMITELEKELGK